MANHRQTALAEFKRIMKWIAAVASVMVVGALTYLKLVGALDTSMAVATTLGVFLSVVLGCGLFAAAFFSDKSGLDEEVAHATRSRRGLGQTSTQRKKS